MSTELATKNDNAIANTAVNSELDSFLGDYVRGGDFYPRIKFFNASATVVKRKAFPENHYGLIKSKTECVDLGESFAAAVLSYRITALDFTEKGKVKRYHDPNDKELQRIKRESEVKRPNNEQNPYMAGLEFLLWNPEHGYMTLLCYNHSLKLCAGKLTGLCKAKKAAQFAHTLVDGKYVYEAPEVVSYMGSMDVPPEAWDKAGAFARVSGKFQEDDSTYEGEVEMTTETGRTR